MSDSGRPNFFPNAQSPTINRGVMAAVQGNAYFQSSPTPSLSERRGMKILVDYIASGAFHDASERGDPPKCHKDTRKAIIAQITKWRLKHHDQFHSVLWLNGPAGAGKSAIMQTIAEMCALEEALGGSFFFARTAPERNNPSRFIATLAYQIVQVYSGAKEYVVEAIEEDQAIFTRKLATQVQVLIVQPLNKLPQPSTSIWSDSPISKIFVIDALDECLTGIAQREVLDAITSIVRDVKLSPPPFVFLVSSRPEYEIRQAFNFDNNHSLGNSGRINLQPNFDADLDIEVFLQSAFHKIKETHPIRSLLPLEWPTEQQMRYLVYTSSSQFIYAATAAQYIDSPRHNPFIRLNTILTPGSVNKDTPFAQLDNLYKLVLGAVTELPMVLEILTFLVLRLSERITPTIDFVSTLFGFDQGDIRLALTDMYALINVPAASDDWQDVLRIHHASMVDFLTDASRSGKYYIDSTKGHTHLAKSFLTCIMRIQNQEDSASKSGLLNLMIAGFIVHYPHAQLRDELKSALDNFNIEGCLAKMTPTQFYDTEWNDLFTCLIQNEYSKGAIHDRIKIQFDVWIRNSLRQYPNVLQSCIPAAYSIFPQYYLNSTEPIFSIIVARQCDAKAIKLLDNNLFQFQKRGTFGPLADFFNDPDRAGGYFPKAVNYKVLAEEIIESICPVKRDLNNLGVHLYASGWSPPYHLPYDGDDDSVISLHDRFCEFDFFGQILAKCPDDMVLAGFLLNRVVQLPAHAYIDRIGDGREKMGKMGLQYLKDCGVAYYSIHVHIEGLHRCLICDEKKKAELDEDKEDEDREEDEMGHEARGA